MIYIVTRPKSPTKQMSYEELLFDLINEKDLYKYEANSFSSTTRTTLLSGFYATKEIEEIIDGYIDELKKFYELHKHMDIFFNEEYNYEKQIVARKKIERELMRNDTILNEQEIIKLTTESLNEQGLKFNPFYYTFYLPKRSGKGFRQIDAPEEELKLAQTQLKMMFERMMNFNTYHTSAYAYIPKRSRVDLVKKLQRSKTRWTLHIDFANFFGSIDIDFTMRQLGKIYPFSEIIEKDCGREALYNCLKFCFLDGRLPQGTPISPLLTNIIMIPLDFKITRALSTRATEITNFDKPDEGENFRLTYTRYADDIFIGGHRGFNHKPVVDFIKDVIKEENAPLSIKDEKTKYKSINGENWILGLMYNSDQEITVGRKRKKQVQAMVANFAMDIINNQPAWDLNDIQITMGHIAYIGQIEPDYCESMLQRLNTKFGFDILGKMKEIAYQ